MPRCESAVGLMTSKKLQHLTPGATYEVQVLAFLEADGNRTNGKTEKIHFTTAQVPAVEQLRVISVESTSIELSWAPAANSSVSHFDIDACPTDGGACVHVYTDDWSHLIRGLTPETTYNIHVRSVTEEEKELSFGPASNVSATTMQLPALDNVSVRATCDSFIIASWNYSLEGITGFLLNLCAGGQSCITRTVDKADQEHTFKVDPVLRQYTLSIEAYIWKGNTKYASVGVNTSVLSFPEGKPNL
ncbi:von Willebrand factor A domain-containing protein 1-like [Amblyomma americanum]